MGAKRDLLQNLITHSPYTESVTLIKPCDGPSGPSCTNSQFCHYRCPQVLISDPCRDPKLTPKDMQPQACNQSFTTSVSQSITHVLIDDFRYSYLPTLKKLQEFLQYPNHLPTYVSNYFSSGIPQDCCSLPQYE